MRFATAFVAFAFLPVFLSAFAVPLSSGGASISDIEALGIAHPFSFLEGAIPSLQVKVSLKNVKFSYQAKAFLRDAQGASPDYDLGCSRGVGATVSGESSIGIALNCKVPSGVLPGRYKLVVSVFDGKALKDSAAWGGESGAYDIVVSTASQILPVSGDAGAANPDSFGGVQPAGGATPSIPAGAVAAVDRATCSAPSSSGNSQGDPAFALVDAPGLEVGDDSAFEPAFQKILVDLQEHKDKSGNYSFSQYSDSAKKQPREIGADWLNFAFKLTGARKGEIIGVYLVSADGEKIFLCNSNTRPFRDDNPNSKGFFYYGMKCQIPLRTKNAFTPGTNYRIFVQLETPLCGPVVRNGAPNRFWGKSDESYCVALTGKGASPKPVEVKVLPKAEVLPKPAVAVAGGKAAPKPAAGESFATLEAWLAVPGAKTPVVKPGVRVPSGEFKAFYFKYSLKEAKTGNVVVGFRPTQGSPWLDIGNLELSKIWLSTSIPWITQAIEVTNLQLVLVDGKDQEFYSNEISVPLGALYSERDCGASPLKLVYTHPLTKKEYGVRFCALIEGYRSHAAFFSQHELNWVERVIDKTRQVKKVPDHISIVFSKLYAGIRASKGGVALSYRTGGLDSKSPGLTVSVQLADSFETPLVGYDFGDLEKCVSRPVPVPDEYGPIQYSLTFNLEDKLCNACDVPAKVSVSSQGDPETKATTALSVPCEAKTLAVTALDLSDPLLKDSVGKLVAALPDSTRVVSLASEESLKYYALGNLAVNAGDSNDEKAKKVSLATTALLEKTGADRLLIIGDSGSIPTGKAIFGGKQVNTDGAYAGLDGNGDPKKPVLRIEGGAGNDLAGSSPLAEELGLVAADVTALDGLSGGSLIT